jgi:NADH:ubiquinone oxidoreductase subunit 3 (subunit A)
MTRTALFRRSKSEAEAATAAQPTKPDGKGRPTPSRREAEAAARARARTPRTRKELARQQRETRTESSRKVREAMKTGDERYFLPRDKGPVRRFVRDFVDVRFSVVELMLPVLVVSMVLTYSGSASLRSTGSTIMMGMLLLVVIDLVILRFRLRRELASRFPDESTKGATLYAVTRAMQMKFMRLPKPQVRIGETLPDRYR